MKEFECVSLGFVLGIGLGAFLCCECIVIGNFCNKIINWYEFLLSELVLLLLLLSTLIYFVLKKKIILLTDSNDELSKKQKKDE